MSVLAWRALGVFSPLMCIWHGADVPGCYSMLTTAAANALKERVVWACLYAIARQKERYHKY